MPKSIFDRIVDWPYHPQMMLTIAYALCFTACIQSGAPAWAELIAVAIAVAIVAPFAAMMLFLPYVFIVSVLALLLSLPQVMQALFHCLGQKLAKPRLEAGRVQP